MSGQFHAFIDHPLAFCTVQARSMDGMIVINGISLKKPGTAVRRFFTDRRLNAAVRVLRSILDGTGEEVEEDCALDLSWCTPFQKSILAAARKIPKGTTISYGELAMRAGYPKAVRAAASVMRKNRFPLVIPCHRVIRSDGTTGGFMGRKHGWTIGLKRKLLENEWKTARCQPVAGHSSANTVNMTANSRITLCR